MIDRLTPEATKVIELAQADARKSKRAFLGTEQVLIGLLELGGPLAQLLTERGVDKANAEPIIKSIIGEEGPGSPPDAIPLTGRLKTALELACDESNKLSHGYIAPEHLLLGILREPKGIGTRTLQNLGVDFPKLRYAILALLAENREMPAADSGNLD